MTKEDVNELLEKFPDPALLTNADFGIFHYAGADDQEIIRANREGLVLFAHLLLKAAKEAESATEPALLKSVPLEYTGNWLNDSSDTVLLSVEPPLKETFSPSETVNYSSDFFEKALPVGCVVLALILVAAVVVGILTLGKWIF